MNIIQIARQIDEARADIALLARLQEAPKRLAELEKAHAAALVRQEASNAAKAQAELEASYEGVTDISVAEVVGQNGPVNLPYTPFDITYTQPAYDMYSGKSLAKKHTVRGFGALPRGAFLYLIDKRPEQIPAGIMALAPNDPRAAFDRYFVAKRRGHL